MSFVDITGQRFGRLAVISQTENKGHEAGWSCRCDCGKTVVIRGSRLRSGTTTSCGCSRIKHGAYISGKKSIEYQSWEAMRRRCQQPSHRSYHNYGGRGITVCDRWRDFRLFLADMGPRPSKEHSIERRDNNGNYEPDNCYWATRSQQRNNSRQNRFVEYKGERLTLAQWAQRKGVSYRWFCNKLRYRSFEEVYESLKKVELLDPRLAEAESD